MSARLRDPARRWFGRRVRPLDTACGDVGPLGHTCALPAAHAFTAWGPTHYAEDGRVGWVDGPESRAMVFLLDAEVFASIVDRDPKP